MALSHGMRRLSTMVVGEVEMNAFKDISHLKAGDLLWVTRPTLHDFYGNVNIYLTEYVVVDPVRGFIKSSKFEADRPSSLYCEEFFLSPEEAKAWACQRLVNLLSDMSVRVSSVVSESLCSVPQEVESGYGKQV